MKSADWHFAYEGMAATEQQHNSSFANLTSSLRMKLFVE